jgi:predicted Zn-ribbon and HTH transcriptional regulator
MVLSPDVSSATDCGPLTGTDASVFSPGSEADGRQMSDDSSMEDATTRQRIADALRDGPATASDLSREIGIPRSSVYGHLQHVARSLDGGGEQFLVAPPECKNCGFSAFDDPVNYPSRCPKCRNEGIEEAVYKVE